MSIVTNFDNFKVNEEDTEVPTPVPTPVPAEDTAAEPSAPAEDSTPEEEPKTEDAPKEEVKADEPQPEEHKYNFTWYGWVPSYGDFDQDWMEVSAKSDKEAIEKLSDHKPIQYSKGGVGLDTLDGENPKGATSGTWEEGEDGTKTWKSVEVDFKNKKFILSVSIYPKDYWTNPKENPKKIEKQDIEPFFTGDSSTETKVDENIEMMPETGSLEQKFDGFCKSLESTGKGAKITLTPEEIIVEFGFNYPDNLAELAFSIAEECGISLREISVCAESTGHKSLNVCRVNGGPKNWSMLNRYGRR